MLASLWIFVSALVVALIAPAVAHALKLAEFRQAWINELRKDVAEYMGLARKWAKGYEHYEELIAREAPHDQLNAKEAEVSAVLTEARVLMWRIQMRINQLENQNKALDDEFLAALASLTDVRTVRPNEPDVSERWHSLAGHAVTQSRLLLKREWEVTKQLPILSYLRKLASRRF